MPTGPACELDAEGMPWDARIHGETRARIANGNWKRRRNTPDATWETVRAELRQTMAAPAPTVASYVELPADSSPTAVAEAFADLRQTMAAPVPLDPAAAFASVPVPPTPPAPVATVPPAPVATAAAEPFTDLLVRITGDQAAGTISVDQVQAAAVAAGLPSIRELMKRPDLVPVVSMALYGE